MGSRGAFVNVANGDFSFNENGQTYYSVNEWPEKGIKLLVRPNESVKAPEFSHSPERIYAILQKGRLKHLVFYGKNHKQTVCIDLTHSHHGVQPHKHLNLNHNDQGISLSAEEQSLINDLKRKFHLK